MLTCLSYIIVMVDLRHAYTLLCISCIFYFFHFLIMLSLSFVHLLRGSSVRRDTPYC